jgi:NADH dehydrogenase (ubiquinone) 1 beta subcomplex subunit 9
MSTSFSSAHRLYVKSLYRRMLKNELDWVVRRDIWRGRAMMIRAEFERNRSVAENSVVTSV